MKLFYRLKALLSRKRIIQPTWLYKVTYEVEWRQRSKPLSWSEAAYRVSNRGKPYPKVTTGPVRL